MRGPMGSWGVPQEPLVFLGTSAFYCFLGGVSTACQFRRAMRRVVFGPQVAPKSANRDSLAVNL